MRFFWLAILFPLIIRAQSFEEKVQGTWYCINIVDSLSNPAIGEFGGPRNFLKFEFDQKKLYVALSPFDKGASNRITYGDKFFEIANANFTQKRYRKVAMNDETLLLETTTAQNARIYYQFISAKKYSKDLDLISNRREYDKLIVEMTYVKNAMGYYMSSYYLIDNTILNLLPSPQFVDKQYPSVGSYMEGNLKIPLIQMIDLKGQHTIFEFDVTENGIENIAIVKNLGMEIDFQIYDLINGMSKKWQPLVVDGKTYITRLRIKLEFAYKEK